MEAVLVYGERAAVREWVVSVEMAAVPEVGHEPCLAKYIPVIQPLKRNQKWEETAAVLGKATVEH